MSLENAEEIIEEEKPLGLTEDSLLNVEEVEEVEEESELSEIEQTAMDQGWTPKDQFNGNPDNWKPAAQYVEWGEMRNSITSLTKAMKGMKKSHNEDIVNLNTLHKASLEDKEATLRAQLEAAVEDGDFAKVGEINKEQLAIEKSKDKLEDSAVDDVKSDKELAIMKAEWELENDWINDPNDKRSGVASSAYTLAMSQGKSLPDALEFVNNTIAEKFPDGGGKPKAKVNPNRINPSRHANNSGGGSREAKLSMSDCTSDELKYRELFNTDEKFLKTVANNRKGA